jgi:hypothetical protein
MFIGHYAVGLAVKRFEPRLSLPVLLAAPQALDLVWPLFVLIGVERVEVAPGDTAFTPLHFTSYPWSHSLVMSLLWGVGLAIVVRAYGATVRAAAITAALVVSHWALDVMSHRADVPLWPGGGPLLGLGLWRSVPATLAVELLMFAGAAVLYARATTAKDRTGTWTYVSLVAFLLVVYLANVVGPPPPSARAVVISALGLWLIPFWGMWIERHRDVRRASIPS